MSRRSWRCGRRRAATVDNSIGVAGQDRFGRRHQDRIRLAASRPASAAPAQKITSATTMRAVAAIPRAVTLSGRNGTVGSRIHRTRDPPIRTTPATAHRLVCDRAGFRECIPTPRAATTEVSPAPCRRGAGRILIEQLVRPEQASCAPTRISVVACRRDTDFALDTADFFYAADDGRILKSRDSESRKYTLKIIIKCCFYGYKNEMGVALLHRRFSAHLRAFLRGRVPFGGVFGGGSAKPPRTCLFG